MTQHYISDLRNSDYVCGASAIGRRHPSQTSEKNADCILCRAILDRKPVYVVLSRDEDGHIDAGYMLSIESQVEYAELVNEFEPTMQMMYILLPDEIATDDIAERFSNYEKALKSA